MADVKTFIKPTQGVPYQGMFLSPENTFRVNGFDVEVIHYQIDAEDNELTASETISTNLKQVYAGKVIIPDGTGNAASHQVLAGQGGNVVVKDLDDLAAGDSFILVVYGSSV